MIHRLRALVSGDTLRARALRGSALTFVNFGGAQILRLASNLILTRILFPEVFGLMALVQVFLIGIEMFSDIGIKTSIMQDKRGDDPAFLNTAWTVQILRGVLLWLLACAIAGPIAGFYDTEMLAVLIPIVGLNGILLGLQSTNMATANRNLSLGRLTALELGATTLGLVAAVVLAWWLQSVWALVISGLASSCLRTGLSHLVLPGIRNRLYWDPSAFRSLFHFGKYIFLSSVAGFVMMNIDRVILGKYVDLAELGVYSIAFALAGIPTQLSQMFVSRIMLPIYRERPPTEGPDNRRQLSKARFGLTGGLLGLCLLLGLLGDGLVRLLYDDRYAAAGPILCLFAIAIMPSVLTGNYASLFLARGASNAFAALTIVSAIFRGLLMWAGVHAFGIPGVMLGIFCADLAIYPVLLALLRRHAGWDLKHDALFGLAICAGAALIVWVNQTAILGYLGLG